MIATYLAYPIWLSMIEFVACATWHLDCMRKRGEKKQRRTSDFVIVVIIGKITLIFQAAAATFLIPILFAPKLYVFWINKSWHWSEYGNNEASGGRKGGERLPEKVPCSPSSLFSGSYTASCKRRWCVVRDDGGSLRNRFTHFGVAFPRSLANRTLGWFSSAHTVYKNQSRSV